MEDASASRWESGTINNIIRGMFLRKLQTMLLVQHSIAGRLGQLQQIGVCASRVVRGCCKLILLC